MLALTGCQGKPAGSGTASTAAESSKETETETEASWTEDNQLELYNNYIEISNALGGRLNDCLNRYFQYVDYTEEFTLLDQKGYYSCYTMLDHQIKEMDDAYSLLQDKTEQDALDESYLKLYPILKDLSLDLSNIDEYTEAKTYLTDD